MKLSGITSDLFSDRLESSGITEQDLVRLLMVDDAACATATSPDWLAEIEEAYSEASLPLDIPEAWRGSTVSGFLNLAAPLLARGRERLLRGLEEVLELSPQAPYTATEGVELVYPDLLVRCIRAISRTLVLEMNVARMENALDGDTPEARFTSFVEALSEPDFALRVFDEYPVLARDLAECVQRWVSFGLSLFTHLANDWGAIASTFAPDITPTRLTGLEIGAGDTHRGGKSVVIASFDTGLRIVYKPRPMSIDVHFQELLTWFNDLGVMPPLQSIRVLDMEDHGWVEFVSLKECNTPDEARRFFTRQGMYLALLYALESVDFHSENLIASGEHPVFIDLEPLFHPTLGYASGVAVPLDESALSNTVLRVALLPIPRRTGEDGETYDIGGMSDRSGQPLLNPVGRWESAGSDDMHRVDVPSRASGANNTPRLDGESLAVWEYESEVVAGFKLMYRAILEHRAALTAPSGPVMAFAEDESRVILRSTRVYGTLLADGTHPDFLRDGLDRDRLFDNLWGSTAYEPHLRAVIGDEVKALWDGDVPYYSTTPESRDLTMSDGRVIRDYLDRSGLDLVLGRIGRMDESDLERQLWVIRSTFTQAASGRVTDAQRNHRVETSGDVPNAMDLRDRLVTQSVAVAERLLTLAIQGADEDVTWLGLSDSGGGREQERAHWVLSPVNTTLYEGLGGIAMFLAYLGDVTGEERFISDARRVATSFLRRLDLLEQTPAPIGGFSGWGSALYVLTHLASLWKDTSLWDSAAHVVESISANVDSDDHFDVIGGSAGAIAALLGFHDVTGSPRALEVAVQCGDKLLADAVQVAGGVGWLQPKLDSPLSGFAHGNSGIAWALSWLADVTGEQRFSDVARDAIRYERTLFSEEAQNWRDVRKDESDAPRYATSWCYGAPGIGLSRLHQLGWTAGDQISSELEAALAATLRSGFGSNHSLCHGDLGNAELPLQVVLSRFATSDLRETMNRLTFDILTSIETYGPLCGVERTTEMSGLMTGLSGIGYGLLRLAWPERVPSVVTLSPPMSAQASAAN